MNAQKRNIERLEADLLGGKNEKQNQEVAFAEAQRKLKSLEEDRDKASELKEIDLKNLANKAERKA